MKHNLLIDSLIEEFENLSQPFGLLITNGEVEEPLFYHDFEKDILQKDEDANLKFGISKFVIVPSQTNYVIKIPFSGIYEYYDDDMRYYEEEDLSQYTYTIYNDYPYFYSQFSQVKDYCDLEFNKYQNLYKQNLDCFVAKTAFYTELSNKIKIFTQEKITPCIDDWTDHKPTPHSKDLAKCWIKEDDCALEPNWLANCIDYYGEQKTKRFINYCYDEDPDILSDTHMSNLGYRPDGTPVILDFSGFQD